MFDHEESLKQETWPEGRHCKTCGGPLSTYNPGDRCFRHSPAIVVDIDSQERVFKREEYSSLEKAGILSVCTSRRTPGFNKVQMDYYGSVEDD